MRVLVVLLLLPTLLPAQNAIRFLEEFNGKELDLSRWVPHDPWAAGLTPNIPEVSGGLLHLGPGQVMTTYGLFSQLYGRLEIRVRLRGNGEGARFQLLPVPLGKLPSIEAFSAAGAKISFGNSWGNEQTERTFGDSFDAPEPGFHVLSVEWDRAKITWAVDGKTKLEAVDGVPAVPMFLLLAGPMDVDYIHIADARLN